MWFKNLQIYRLAPEWKMTAGALEEKLAKHPLLPCSGLSMQTRGWVSPGGEAQLVFAQGKQYLIALGVEQKLLPASVINQTAQQRAQDLETKQGYKPGKKQLRLLKEQVATELLPRAFARQSSTRAWINMEAGWLVVDAASPKRAEELIEHLRHTLGGSLPLTLLDTEMSAQGAMTQWLSTGDAPGAFSLHEDCELKGSGETESTVRYTRHGLEGKDIRDHIKNGKTVRKLGLTWKDRLGLILKEPLSVARFRFLDLEQGKEDAEMANPEDQFDADFALMTGEASALISDLIVALGGEKK